MTALSKKIAASCATLSLIALCACSATAQKAELSGTPVVKVNGTAITRPQLERAVKGLLARNGGEGSPAPEELKKATETALEQLASAELLYQAASKMEIEDLAQQVARRYAQNKARFPSQAEYEKAVKGFGMTEDDVRLSMRKEIVVNTFIEREFGAKAAVTEAEAKAFYDDNRDKYFTHGERLNAAHILVAVDAKASAAEKSRAREKAEAILKRVKGGEDFAALAKKESSCPSRARGGELGVFGKGEMAPSFEKAAYALEPGEVSPVVLTQFGYHIIKLNRRIEGGTDDFEEVREKVTAYLKSVKVQQAVAAFVNQLRSRARIQKV